MDDNFDNNDNFYNNFIYNFEINKILFRLELFKIENNFVLIKIININNKNIFSEKFQISDLKINNNNNIKNDSFEFFKNLFQNNLNNLNLIFSSENLILNLYFKQEKIKLNLKLKKFIKF
jgi:hypothetical protein